MRVAVAGKGGAGKTMISATLSLLVARQGVPVVAVDADANPNLAIALGLTPDVAGRVRAVPPELVSRRRGGPGLTSPLDEVLARYAVKGPDGVQLIGMGAPRHADDGCLCAAHAVVSSLLEDLAGSGRAVIVDMEASPEHLSRGTVRHVDAICLVAEPYYRSLETVRRMAALAEELPVPRVVVVANKVRDDSDSEAISDFCGRHGLDLAAVVPWNDDVGAADRQRVPVADRPAASDVTAALGGLAQDLGLADVLEEGAPHVSRRAPSGRR
jgi:CO dehydrogenase maturation factor